MTSHWKVPVLTSVLALAAIAVGPWPAWASHQECTCNKQICSADGFEKTLTAFSVDQLNGTSSWTYEICNQAKGLKVCAPGKCTGGGKDGFGCTTDADCPGGSCTAGSGGGSGGTGDTCSSDADCGGSCVSCAPPHDLSHVDIVLPGLGECVSDTQQISITQLGCPACDPVLTCSMSDRDPSCPAELCAPGTGGKFCQGGVNDGDACTNNQNCGCGGGPGGGPCATPCASVPCQAITSPVPLKVLKCDVSGGNLDPGECVTVQVTVAGENPTVGPGTVDEVTKAGTECTTEQICGPACDCAPPEDKCLTRTAGFWGTHPAITAQFLPVTVCGRSLTTTTAGVCSNGGPYSVSEALCIAPGVEANRTCDKNPAYQQLVRQLAAANLNLAATAANGGNCGTQIQSLIATCELLCGRNQSTISSSGCIQGLDAFNNSQDTFAMTPLPFSNPGPADPTQCQASSGNGLVVGKRCGAFDCR